MPTTTTALRWYAFERLSRVADHRATAASFPSGDWRRAFWIRCAFRALKQAREARVLALDFPA